MKSSVLNASLVIFSILISVLAGEALVRLADYRFFEDRFREYDPDVGWINSKGRVGYRRLKVPIRFEVNSEGFRDLERTTEKPDFVRRIAVIGDSFAIAAQVDIEETFWNRLDRSLNASMPGTVWEVLNFGGSDYGTTQEYMVLEKYALKYRPELVVLQVFPLNDICNNSIQTAYMCSRQDAYRPYLDPDDNFNTITYLNPTITWLRQVSHLYRIADAYFRKYVRDFGGELTIPDWKEWMPVVRDRLKPYQDKLEPHTLPEEKFYYSLLLNVFAHDAHQIEPIRTGWRATESLILRIQEVLNARNISLIVVIIPHPNTRPKVFERWAKQVPFPIDPYYPEARIKDLLKGHGTTVIALTDVFEENEELVYPYVAGHLNPAGHEIVAELLEESVRSQLPQFFPEAAGQN